LWLLSRLLVKSSQPSKQLTQSKQPERSQQPEQPNRSNRLNQSIQSNQPIQQLLQGLCVLCCCVPLLFCAHVVMDRNYTNYGRNAAVNAANRATIAAYTGEGSLTLHKFPVDLYSWVMPYHNPYYNPYFNLYYGLPQETVIVWE